MVDQTEGERVVSLVASRTLTSLSMPLEKLERYIPDGDELAQFAAQALQDLVVIHTMNRIE